tara:strand:- start:353 stop:652 length:300 start_codon:yes stop_codon:yes gene_type:complete
MGKNDPEKKNIGEAISVKTRVRNVVCGATDENKKPNEPNVTPTIAAGISIPIECHPLSHPNIAATIPVPITVKRDLVVAQRISPKVISVIVIGVVNAVS